MAVNWNGRKLFSRLRRAQIKGGNKTMATAVVHAKQNHEWKNRTATLEGSIGIAEFATPRLGGGVTGLWGSRDVIYAAVHELGSEKLKIPARPYLRPAADEEYPNLARNIREAFVATRPGGGAA